MDNGLIAYIIEYIRQYPLVGIVVAVVVGIVTYNVAKTAIQAVAASMVVLVAYVVFLIVTGQDGPDVNEFIEDSQAVGEVVKDEGLRQMDKLKQESVAEAVREAGEALEQELVE